MIKPIYQGQTGIIAGCGPSLTPEVIRLCNESGLPLFGVNKTFEVMDLDVFHALNDTFYHEYWDKGLKDIRAEKWSTRGKEVSQKYGVNWIERKWADGMSKDPNYIHDHHGSGPQMLNIAYHYGITTMLLVGWDMRYPGKVDRYNYTGKRHFFGDDVLSGSHFPMTAPDGALTGLINEVATIKPEDYGIKIINCTPDSAMTCFPMMSLEEALNGTL